ncbi:hypothetical protein AVEN_159770-1 [Araneus ventricosus]|uniref:Integrase catalytic domain-containing protein n=1 Tax=Araneus ventricosus TaxID=182803 RepID=A0A4Y2D9I3_ARAVE|nr:hypothetical protein AVEN_159770-1 [Araneus ventricosus]
MVWVKYAECSSNLAIELGTICEDPQVKVRAVLIPVDEILGPFPVTTKGNRYVLVLMDCFTKWTEAIPIPDQGASTVAEELVQTWTSRYGVPMIFHSDQGTDRHEDNSRELHVTSLRAIDRAVSDSISDLLSACVANLNKWCFLVTCGRVF